MSDFISIPIIDSNDTNIGRLTDLILRHSGNGMDIVKFVIGDTKLTEFFERIKIKEDIDPVFSTSMISSMSSRRIKLNIKREELQYNTIDEALDDG